MTFSNWLRNIWHKYGPRRHLVVLNGDTPPESIKDRHTYLCKDEGEDWSLSMQCPCGCGDKLELMLLKEVTPHWTLRATKKRYPTLHPSVWRQSGCNAHFWLRDGRIIWC